MPDTNELREKIQDVLDACGNHSLSEDTIIYIKDTLGIFVSKKLAKAKDHDNRIRADERSRVVELIKSRKPNEYAVRYYKTLQARTWDEKNMVIEALDDLLSALDKPLTDKERMI